MTHTRQESGAMGIPRVTAAMLRDLGVCKEQLEVFEAHWPNGAAVTLRGLAKARRLGLSTGFLAYLLPYATRVGYKKVCDAAWAECDKVSTAARVKYQKVSNAAWAKYQKVFDTALAKYFKVNDTEWAEYREVNDAARAEYRKVCDAARAEYRKACDAALAPLLRDALRQREKGSKDDD